MNWIPELLTIANGNLNDERVIERAHRLWESATTGKYVVDGVKYFNSVDEIADFLHVGRLTVLDLMTTADKAHSREFRYRNHVVELSNHTDKKTFRKNLD